MICRSGDIGQSVVKTLDVSHILDGLNEHQRSTVAAPRGSSLVLAEQVAEKLVF